MFAGAASMREGWRPHAFERDAGERAPDRRHPGQHEAGPVRQLAVLPLDHLAEVGEDAVAPKPTLLPTASGPSILTRAQAPSGPAD